MVAITYDDNGDDPATSGGADEEVYMVPVPAAPAPKTRSPQRELVSLVDLDKLLKGPIDEVYRNHSPGIERLRGSLMILGC